MQSDNDENKVWVHLFGGEQDGFRRKIELKTKPPERVFVLRGNDFLMITEMSVEEHRMLQKEFPLLAYELHYVINVLSERELRYRRAESADRSVPD